MAQHVVVCIARQFGSSGHEVGRALAEAMDVPFYDKELLREAADKSGILQELFEKNDEKPVRAPWGLSPVGDGMSKAPSFADFMAYMPNDRLQSVIAQVIRDAAERSSCVIIGRCADYILRGRPGTLSVFVHAPLDIRIGRVAHLHNTDEDTARSLVRKTDRNRANYYSYYTDRSWDSASNYHLAIDTARFSFQDAVALLQNAAAQVAQTIQREDTE